jgi:hypothetical protein
MIQEQREKQLKTDETVDVKDYARYVTEIARQNDN